METISRSENSEFCLMRTITIDLFSGMGGFALAAHMMGWETAIVCEINPECHVVLNHHFPNAYLHGDIHTLTWKIINEEIEKRYGKGWRNSTRVVLCGGFPCQPYSAAGKRLGKEDARHLWPEMLRVIRECSPDAVVGENVSGIVSWDGGLVFEEVQTDLEAEGYEVQAVVVPACAVGAPHRRDRVWFVANASSTGGIRQNGGKPNNHSQRIGAESELGRVTVSDGVEGGGESFAGIESPPHDNRNMGGGGKDKGKSEFPHDQVCLTTHARLPEPQGRNEVEEGQQHGGWRIARGFLASLGSAWDVADAKGWGAGGLRNETEKAGPRKGSELFGGSGGISVDGRKDTANTEIIGIQRNGAKGKQVERPQSELGLFGRSDRGGVRNHWSNFPTEWPLRIGDDGLSARLGRIRLPGSGKRITESGLNKITLKMAGNAVVPQVVFEIFKALEKTW